MAVVEISWYMNKTVNLPGLVRMICSDWYMVQFHFLVSVSINGFM